VCAAGVTAGIDGALRVAADLRGGEVAQAIQLSLAYAPEPPSEAAHPKQRRPQCWIECDFLIGVTEQRHQTPRRVAERL
jgi:cyclohexyl-isocyanide hydratase